MAEFTLKDGANGNVAKVDTTRRVHTRTVTENETERAAISGIESKININTGDITLTDANKTTLIYVKNNENDDLVITALIYMMGNSTGAASSSVNCLWEVLRNPTAGDIITNANAAAIIPGSIASNHNFGSSNTYSIPVYKGATSEGVISASDGVVVTTRLANNTGRVVVSIGSIVMPKGSSLAVEYTPPTGNTSQIVQCALAAYVRGSDLVGS